MNSLGSLSFFSLRERGACGASLSTRGCLGAGVKPPTRDAGKEAPLSERTQRLGSRVPYLSSPYAYEHLRCPRYRYRATAMSACQRCQATSVESRMTYCP